MIYLTFSISLLDQCTSQPVVCSWWDCQTGLSGRRHPLSHHHLDCEWRFHLRSVTAVWCACLPFVHIGSLIFFIVFSGTTVEPGRSLTPTGSLILKDLNFGDTAIYQCQASNKHGTILINTNVYVIGKYTFPIWGLFNRKCVVVPYFSFLLCFRAASSDPHWGREYIHLCWRTESCAGVWNLWLS